MSKPFKREPGSTEIPAWSVGEGGEGFTDIRYETAEGMAKITINRPEVRNAFRPQTLFELERAFNLARDDEQVGVIIFTGEGGEAFCSGGDINVRMITSYGPVTPSESVTPGISAMLRATLPALPISV